MNRKSILAIPLGCIAAVLLLTAQWASATTVASNPANGATPGRERRHLRADVKIRRLNTDGQHQPPVTGGKNATSSPSASAAAGPAMP